MAETPPKITPFLWFDDEAEAAVAHYTAIFPHSRVVQVTRYDAETARVAGRPDGSVMTVAFELAGQPFVALNGGPQFRFTEAVSFVVNCDSQAEVDRYWERLGAGGDERAQQCGWLKDRYGLSWQVIPSALPELLSHPDPAAAQRVSRAMLQMKKIDIAALQRAAEGR